jgi:hypothetical protein
MQPTCLYLPAPPAPSPLPITTTSPALCPFWQLLFGFVLRLLFIKQASIPFKLSTWSFIKAISGDITIVIPEIRVLAMKAN